MLITLLRAGALIDPRLYCDPLLEAVYLGWKDATRILLARRARM